MELFSSKIIGNISPSLEGIDNHTDDKTKLVSEWETKLVSEWDVDDFNKCMKFLGYDIRIKDHAEFGLFMAKELNINVEKEREKEFDVLRLQIMVLYERRGGVFNKKFVAVLRKLLKFELKIESSEAAILSEYLSRFEMIRKHYLEYGNFYQEYKDTLIKELKDNGEASVKIKLIITENVFQRNEIFVKRVCSKILYILPKQINPRFGLFHTAVIFGPYYLDYVDTSLIIPKKEHQSANALMCIDMKPIDLKYANDKEFSRINTKLAKIIESWNTVWNYGVIPRKNKKIGNCQTFVEAVFQEFGFSFEMEEGCLKKCVDTIRKKGFARFVSFCPSTKFINDFKIDKLMHAHSECIIKLKKGKYKIEFEKHKDLDNFCNGLVKTNKSAFYSNPFYAQTKKLFKAVDRAFWLRHMKDKDDERWRPASPRVDQLYGMGGCPFLDPRLTSSLVAEIK